MIATRHNRPNLAEFLQNCVAIIELNYNSSCQWRQIFLGKMFSCQFCFYEPQAQNSIISIFFQSLHLIQAHNQRFHGRCCHKAGVYTFLMKAIQAGKGGQDEWRFDYSPCCGLRGKGITAIWNEIQDGSEPHLSLVLFDICTAATGKDEGHNLQSMSVKF